MGLLSRIFGRKRKADGDFLSIVYLLRRPRRADDPRLRAALAGLIQRVLQLDEPPATEVTPVSDKGVGLVVAGQPFVVIGVAEPYVTADPADVTPDLRKQNLLREHTAWLSCDWMPPVAGDDDRRLAYQVMGMVMAALAAAGEPDDIVAVYDKGSGRLVPYGPHVPERLIGEFPESVFDENVPVLSAEGLEVALAKATREAQSRLPEFVSALERRDKAGVYAVKAKFEQGESVEWMWLKVEHLTGDGFEGRLDNDPAKITRLKAGDRVAVKPDEIADWIITDAAGMRGGFSIEAFKMRSGPLPPVADG